MMSRRLPVLLSLVLLAPFASAKDKKKIIVPEAVLRARTVLVVVSPEASDPLLNPNANRAAREDVEKALMKWGRFTLVPDGTRSENVDLIIAVRKGVAKTSPTISGGPRDDRPVMVESTDDTIRIGGHQGHPPGQTDPGLGAPPAPPGIGAQIGGSEDAFEVYLAGQENPLDYPPVWGYMAKNALRPPNVQAVEEFRKFLERAEKEQQKQGKSHP
jgi:hypothetical protein